ncbi:hypothetical protein MRAB57_3194 [Mycobacterium rhizamassiliense]|jgi:hypothetical protein|uniref:Uncharacterized protein n=1 Tax=Mycobacterium rhizamassiliense TaxID=1841860 RepID=A0A2U3NV35_9MYCO|nr:hypothetical protein [Mycobacterium rhizamassiliense]SPM35369.1 hypothetical protein MRAB57_3194 [Mycobacterium rhizamassiliense]
MTAVSGIQTRRLYDSTDSLLRFAIRADAALTGVCGLAVALVADPLSSLSGLPPGVEYGLAVFFILYGVVGLGLGATSDLRRAGIGFVAANTAFTVGAVAAAEAVPMTATGIAASLASAMYTAAFARLQYLGVRRLEPA